MGGGTRGRKGRELLSVCTVVDCESVLVQQLRIHNRQSVSPFLLGIFSERFWQFSSDKRHARSWDATTPRRLRSRLTMVVFPPRRSQPQLNQLWRRQRALLQKLLPQQRQR